MDDKEMIRRVRALLPEVAVKATEEPIGKKKEWQGLTDEEVHEAFCHVEYETFNDWKQNPESWCLEFFRYIEVKLKKKNAS